jgi:uncharacterized protein (TIGR03083 family)
MDVWQMLAGERHRFADMAEGLSEDQWATQSLCGAWDVHHLTAHLLTLSVTPMPVFVGTLARQRFSFDRTAIHFAERVGRRSHEELVRDLRGIAEDRSVPPVLGPMGPLTDLLVHRLDAQVPLGLPDDTPPERWTDGPLGLLVSTKARIGFVKSRIPALRYVATDADWSHGSGPEVTGPAAALALAIARRTPRLDELEGLGATALRTWATG